MLIQKRRVDQTLTIDTGTEKIKIVVMKIGSNQVSIGIDAPDHADVFRDELADGRKWMRHARKPKESTDD